MYKKARMICPLVAILIALVILGGCGSNDNDITDDSDSASAVTVVDDGAVLAKVGDVDITSKQLRELTAIAALNAGKKLGDYSDEERKALQEKVLESTISDIVIRQYLEGIGIENMTQEIFASAEQIAMSIRANEGLLGLIEAGEVSNETFEDYIAYAQYWSWFYTDTLVSLELTDDILRKHYEQNKDSYMRTYVVVDHILAANVDEAALALEALENGEEFAAVAEKYSKDLGSRNDGGRLLPFGRNEVLPELEEAAFSMEIGETRGPIRTMYGQHILRLVDKYQELMDFDIVENYIIDTFVVEAANQRLKELKKEASIVYP